MKINQLQIGKDMGVELQIPPSLNWHSRAAEENLRLGGGNRLKMKKINGGHKILD